MSSFGTHHFDFTVFEFGFRGNFGLSISLYQYLWGIHLQTKLRSCIFAPEKVKSRHIWGKSLNDGRPTYDNHLNQLLKNY